MYLQNHIKKLNATDWKDGFEFIPTVNFKLTDKLSYMAMDDIVMNNAAVAGQPNSTYFIHEFSFAYITYQVTEQIAPYLQLKYNHVNDTGFNNRADNFEYYIGVGYSITPKITVTAEMGTEFLAGSDGKTLSDKWKKPEFVLYLDAAI